MAVKKTKKSSKKEKVTAKVVYGVKLGKVDEVILDKWLTEFGSTTLGDPETKIRRIVEHFANEKRAGRLKTLVKCEKCDGLSDVELPECPYCGDDDEVVNSSEGAEDTESAQHLADAAMVSDQANTTSQSPKTSTAKSKMKKRSESKKKKSNKAMTVAQEPLESSSHKMADNVVITHTEKDLDDALARIKGHQANVVDDLYAIGGELHTIIEFELWKLRTDDQGRPAYNSFDSFVKAELPLKKVQAWRLAQLTSNFTLEQMQKFGGRFLMEVLKLPPEERQQVMDDAEKKGKKKALAERTNRDYLTASIPARIFNLIMYKRPKEPARVGKPTTPASTLKDDPWCAIQLKPGATMYIRLMRNEDGAIVAMIDFRPGLDQEVTEIAEIVEAE